MDLDSHERLVVYACEPQGRPPKPGQTLRRLVFEEQLEFPLRGFKIFLLLATLLSCLSSLAQPFFEKYYKGVGTSTMYLSEQSSGNLFTGMAYQSGISIMDPQGNIIHTHCYDLLPFLVLQSVRKYSNNEIYFVGGYNDDSCSVSGTGQQKPVIGKMDSLGNILAAHSYQLNGNSCQNMAQDLEITSDKGVIAWGGKSGHYAIRVDSAGSPLWARQFTDNSNWFRFIRELPDGDLLAGINTDSTGAVLARLGPDGNIIWCKSYFRPMGVVVDCLINPDSSMIIVGYTDDIGYLSQWPANRKPKVYMMKIDGSGDVQWCKGYESTPRWFTLGYLHIENTNDDNYVLLANYSASTSNYPSRSFLMKTDHNGDTLWTRAAGIGGYEHNSFNLQASSDGGFYYSGYVEGNAFYWWGGATYLFKTDSLGHLPCSDVAPPLVIVTDLFPTDSSFTLTSVDGATAFPLSIADTLYPPVDVIDGCTITQIPNYALKRPPPRIRPNPTTGRFTMDFVDPLRADSFYSVYDSMGKLLYQRPLPGGATTEEVDLARFGKGMYLLKITDLEGVRTERVVVE